MTISLFSPTYLRLKLLCGGHPAIGVNLSSNACPTAVLPHPSIPSPLAGRGGFALAKPGWGDSGLISPAQFCIRAITQCITLTSLTIRSSSMDKGVCSRTACNVGEVKILGFVAISDNRAVCSC